MKTRVTFRVSRDLARALRELPNQTQFVEEALRDALGKKCSVCGGSGRVPAQRVVVSDFRRARLPRLDRGSALELRNVVRLGRTLAATRLDLDRDDGDLAYVLSRRDEVLLRGSLRGAAARGAA